MRRELRFKNFNDVRAELDRLEKGEVETTGQWTYFQILNHCAKATEGSTKGTKRELSWWKRHVMGPIGYHATVFRGYLPAGIGLKPGVPVERVEGDEKAAMAHLRKALDEFEKFEGHFSDHPRLGNFNKKKWTAFHLMHLANHLGHARRKD